MRFIGLAPSAVLKVDIGWSEDASNSGPCSQIEKLYWAFEDMKKPSVVTLGLLKSRDYILGESSCAFVDDAECLADAKRSSISPLSQIVYSAKPSVTSRPSSSITSDLDSAMISGNGCGARRASNGSDIFTSFGLPFSSSGEA
jgi:hypothetical protein